MRFFTGLLLAAGMFALSAHGQHETPVEAGRRTQTLYIGNGAEPRDLDPHVIVAYTDLNILLALFEGLTVLDEATSQPLPGVAERWDISADGLTYTFHLRADAKWSNGDPVTAGDFAFSLERSMSPKLGSEYVNMLFAIKNAEAYAGGKISDFAEVGVKALDERTLQITLEHPTPYLLSLAAHNSWFPVHPPTVRKHGDIHARGTGWTKPENFVGNGAFTLSEWAPDRRIVVKKSPTYWDNTHTRLNEIVFYPISNLTVDESNFRAGQVHITYELLPDRLGYYQRRAPEQLRVDPFLESWFIRFNVTRTPFQDKRVRQALARAIDREAINKAILRGSRVPAYFLTPPGTAGYTCTARTPTDFNAARKLLAEAGFPEGKNFPKLTITMDDNPINRPIFEAIQQMWRKELGISVELAPSEFRVYVDNMQHLNFDILRSRWVGDYNDPSTFTDLFTSTSGNNNTGWKNREYDRLIEAAGKELDSAKRFALLQQAEALLLDEAPIAPLLFGARTYLIHPSVKGWLPSLLGVHRYQRVWLE